MSVRSGAGRCSLLLLSLYGGNPKSMNIPAQRHFFRYASKNVKWVDLALQKGFKPLGTSTLESGSLAIDLIKILKL